MAKKYIDADRLKAEVERRKQSLRAGICSEDAFTKEQKREMLVASEEIDRFNRIIDSLQQEQPEVGLEKKFTFPKFLFARTLDNKTIDISYAPQSVEAVEYVRNDFIEQGQESVAERFARIVRGNLIGIDKEVQQKFEQLYFEVTGNKMYGGYND